MLSDDLLQHARFAPRVVGVVHLPALPGTVQGGPVGSMAAILDAARRDAAAYAAGGTDALIVENYGDAPFRRGRVESSVVAAMTLATEAIAAESGLPVGVNVLRNDVLSAVSIASVAGGRFVRANVYVGAAVTDQGIIQGEAEQVQLLIRRLGRTVDVWADVEVKHAAQLGERPQADQAEDAIMRGLAAAVIVTGTATGRRADDQDFAAVRTAVGRALLYAGSGVTKDNVHQTLKVADGVIVGTAMKIDGVVTQPVDIKRVRELVAAANRA